MADDKKTPRRLEPRSGIPGIGSSALGADDATVLERLKDDAHVAKLRKSFSHLDDEAFAKLIRSISAELARPMDPDEELEDEDE